ncbi:MAG: cell division FtsA domain-containing protein [Clostridia bacterium]|nr:cell division FtsA domain-containing protein [Clostridia bacterium]
MKDTVFVLDIGTRSVMALWASLQEGEMIVEHLLSKEHQSRAMLDGQIHHVEDVVHLVDELVREMQELTGQELKEVAVAAAGRALETVKGSAEINYPVSTVFTKEEILSLELQAVQEAQLILPKEQANIPLSQQYYCVGYSVVEERLDNIKIGSLVGQKGEKAQIEVIATFLPRMVVDSLQYVVESLGLEIASITLEPIAVANLVLNSAMRRLNLVLVDIGAGTSDIAVCGGDFISAFGMVPMAGDEITEAISEQYLLDFNRAEEVKRQLTGTQEIRTVNVLGKEEVYAVEEIRQSIQPSVAALAAAMAEAILELNNKVPQALLLVGGGSLTVGLDKSLAQILNMPEDRVAVQQANQIQQIRNLPGEFIGPNFITVLAIAYTALTNSRMGFISVNINGQSVRMLNLAQNNVTGALLAGGYDLRDVYARLGMALTCEINGNLYSIPGKEGKRGEILLNDNPVGFSEEIKQGDNITFIPGEKGQDAVITFGELLQKQIGTCSVNGQEVELLPVIKVGDKIMSIRDFVSDGCKAEIENEQTIEEVLQKAGLIVGDQYVMVNDQKINLLAIAEINKNGEKAHFKDEVYPGDNLTFVESPQIYIKDLIPDEVMTHIEVTVNDHPVKLNSLQVWLNKIKINPREAIFLKNGDILEYQIEGPLYKPILVDIFNEIDFSTVPPPGKSKLVFLLNDVEREYTYPLQQGDRIQIRWE